jgi:hypothetical protein
MGKVLSKDKKEEDQFEEKRKEHENQYLKRNNVLKVDCKKIKAINHSLLRQVYDNNFEAFRNEISDYRTRLSQKEFEWEISAAFWLSVHLRRLEFAEYLVQENVHLKRLVYHVYKFKGNSDFKSEEMDNSSQGEEIKGIDSLNPTDEKHVKNSSISPSLSPERRSRPIQI